MIGTIPRFAAGVVAVPLAIALGLIASQRPVEMAGEGGLDFSGQVVRKGDPLPVEKVAMRDGPPGPTATTAYSHLLNTSCAPRSAYEADIAALPRFLLIAGAEDEAFFADRYEPHMVPLTGNGQYRLVAGVSHHDIVGAPETQASIADFIDEL